MGKQIIGRLDIDLLGIHDEEFADKRREYVAEHTASPFNWTKDRAEAEWEKEYPNKEEYKAKNTSLNGRGEQRVINKINEIIDYINNSEEARERGLSLEDHLKTLL